MDPRNFLNLINLNNILYQWFANNLITDAACYLFVFSVIFNEKKANLIKIMRVEKLK